MPGADRTPPWRRVLALAIGVFFVALLATGALAIAAARSFERPAIYVLGSGDGLSVLVVAGRSRLLLATGDDPAAFGNALGRAQPWSQNRLDIVLLAGSANELTFLDRAMGVAHGRHTEFLGSPSLLGSLGLSPDSLLASPRRFRLSNDVLVTVEMAARPDQVGGTGAPTWRVVVERGATRLAVLPDGGAVKAFPSWKHMSVVIVGGQDALDAVAPIRPGAVVVSAHAISGKAVRQHLPGIVAGAVHVVRVHPGDAAALDFVDGGLRLPDDAVEVSGTPSPPKATIS
jgi:hypothetical protein